MITVQDPAASAVLGSPNNNMPDVIDALKRLERVGSEHSKTTEKLIAAAAELSKEIVANAGANRNELIAFDTPPMLRDKDNPRKMRLNSARKFHYCILDGQLLHCHGEEREYVAANRDAALRFSEDIANGLLDFIVEMLESRCQRNEKATGPLKAATEDPSKLPDEY